jgi:hypothetical protein
VAAARWQQRCSSLAEVWRVAALAVADSDSEKSELCGGRVGTVEISVTAARD